MGDVRAYRVVALDLYRTLLRSIDAHVALPAARRCARQRAAQQFRVHGAAANTPAQAEQLLRRAHMALLASLPQGTRWD